MYFQKNFIIKLSQQLEHLPLRAPRQSNTHQVEGREPAGAGGRGDVDDDAWNCLALRATVGEAVLKRW